MTSNAYFNGARFAHLLRLEGVFGYKRILVVGLATIGILFLLGLFTGYVDEPREFHLVWYPILLLLGGFIYTSTSFSELDTRESRISYLNLPASALEKFLSKFLITNLGYLIVTTLVYWIFSMVLDALVAYWFSFEMLSFEPFSEENLLIIRLYFVLQGIFLIGAIFFNRYAFFKTVLTLIVASLVVELLLAIVFRLVFWEHFEGFYSPVENLSIRPNQGFLDFIEFQLWPFTQYLFWLALPPFLWVVAYFKLKEREV